MSACTQCGTVVKPSDKFCSVCGTPIPRSSAPADPIAYGAAATAYSAGQGGPAGYPATGQAGAGGALTARCQLGHEIAPGASYCGLGHPIALEPMHVNDAYGGYAQPGAAPPYSPQRPAAGGPYGTPAPPAPFGGSDPGFAVPPPQAAYASAFGTPAAPPAGLAPLAGYGPPPGTPYGGSAHPSPSPYGGPPPPAPYASFPPDVAREPAPPKVLRGFLVAYGTNPSGDFWPLTAGRLTVGRFGTGEGLDIALQDPTISSRHAAFVVDGASGTVTIEDTGSTNGTFINDEHVGYGGRRELRDGDRIRFGGFTTVVKVIGRV
jgi:hypothetical protein